MSETSSERRLTENEVVFRQLNQRMQHGVEETNRLAREDNQPEYLILKGIADIPLHFFCECSDENCTKRVILMHDEYTKIHKRNNHFIVFPSHEVLSIEKIVDKKDGYYVVEKFTEPPKTASTLHPTSVDNT